MTVDEKYNKLTRAFHIPGGLQNQVGNIITSLFSDPSITYRTIKDITLFTDRIIFFYKKQVIFELQIPSETLSTIGRKQLTKTYKSLLK